MVDDLAAGRAAEVGHILAVLFKSIVTSQEEERQLLTWGLSVRLLLLIALVISWSLTVLSHCC